MDQYVVRAGLARPGNLISGTTPHRDIPGLTGFSVQSAPGVSVCELARGGEFRNGWISVAKVSDLRRRGFEIICPTPGKGLYHATCRVAYPLPMERAFLLSSLFIRRPNPHIVV
jgi:hypothetical protein